MNALAFPLLGALVVFLLAVPAATVLAKAVLVLRRRSTRHLPRFGSTATWLVIIAPVIAPVLWFISAAVHQSEPGGAIAACLFDHFDAFDCRDELVFALCLTLLLLVAGGRRLRHELAAPGAAGGPVGPSSAQARRVREACAARSALGALRVEVVTGALHPICTTGLVRPRVVVAVELVDSLDDEALVAALLHENAHAHALDPLRYFLAAVCLSLNPLAPLLRPELRRWRLAREASCDAEAVHAGGEPLSLAQAIVTAARPGRRPGAWTAALGDGDAEAIRLRIGLLIGYADERAVHGKREAPFVALTGTLTFVAMLPHAVGSGPLDILHLEIERALVLLGLI